MRIPELLIILLVSDVALVRSFYAGQSSMLKTSRARQPVALQESSQTWRNEKSPPISSPRSSYQSRTTGDSLFRTADRFGQSLKSRAVKAISKATLTEMKFRKFVYRFQACSLYVLFIMYRGCRGFFVILPAILRELFFKLQTAVEEHPFEISENDIDNFGETSTTGNLRWTTKITVSLLSLVVTLSYVLGGFVRVLRRFISDLVLTTNVSGSFAAAAMEQETNEAKILLLTRKYKKSNQLKRSSINGQASDSISNDNSLPSKPSL